MTNYVCQDIPLQVHSSHYLPCDVKGKSFCQKSAERKSPKKYFSYFVLMSGLNSDFSANKPRHYLLDHGEIAINVNKLLAVLLLLASFVRYFLYCTLLLLIYYLIPWCCCCLFNSLSPLIFLYWYCYIFV